MIALAPPKRLRPVGKRGRPRGSRDRRGNAYQVQPRPLAALCSRFKASFATRLGVMLRCDNIAADELAAAIGCSKGTVHSWLGGRATPSVWAMLSISIALHCALADLLPDESREVW